MELGKRLESLEKAKKETRKAAHKVACKGLVKLRSGKMAGRISGVMGWAGVGGESKFLEMPFKVRVVRK